VTQKKQKNVVVFYTDQQRYDALGYTGNQVARTPNIDSLAEDGLVYSRHYASNSVCQPSRASFLTGRHLRAHRLIDNGMDLPLNEITMPQVFADAGYATACIGKLHLASWESPDSPEGFARWRSGELDNWTGPYYGFQELRLCLGHGEGGAGHYGIWRRERFPDVEIGSANAQGEENYPEINCYKSNLPKEAHSNSYILEETLKFLDRTGEQPFYLHASFPDPHGPFTPPSPYNTMFREADMPPAHYREGEHDTKPSIYRDAMAGGPGNEYNRDGGPWYVGNMRDTALRQAIAHTHGMNAFVDDTVGAILQALKDRGLYENTIVVYTADHGDFLGDHDYLVKGILPCDALTHVPLIIRDPGGAKGVEDRVNSNVDIMPTLLSKCGLEVPEGVQGVALPELGSECQRDYAYETGYSKISPEFHHYSIVKDDVRFSIFPHLNDGELYDLTVDPYELNNLYHHPDWQQRKQQLHEELLFAVGKAEPQISHADYGY